MKHQLYETWIFADEALTAAQQAELDAHLGACQDCRTLAQAWGQVARTLQAAPVTAPAPGFTVRWEARLEAERERNARRQTLATLVFTVIAAVLLFGSLVMLTLPLVQSPNALLWAWLSRVVSLVTFADVTGDLFGTVLRTVADIVPLGVWVLLTGIASLLGTLWVVSFRLLTAPRRITQ